MTCRLAAVLRRTRNGAARAALVVVVALTPAASFAQQSASDILSFLVVTPPAVQTGDPALDRAAAQATRDTLARSLLSALATLPLTSSSSGFTYLFNPSLGTVERASGNFGPFFVERAATAGAGRAAFALSVQHSKFTQLDGMALRDGTLATTSNRFVDETQPYDVETLQLKVTATTVTVSGSYGLTDRLDVGVAVPFVSLEFAGTRTDTYRGTQFQQLTASSSGMRLGDVQGLAKFNIVRGGWGGFSIGGDVRVPTGAQDNLVGAGRTGERVFLVASAGSGPVTAHVNGGISRGGVSNGFDYGGALAITPTPRLTIVGELFGRRLDEIGRIVPSLAPHPTIAGVETLRLVADPTTSTTSALLSVGAKWNLSNAWLLSAFVLTPLNDAGLTAGWTPAIALEYNLGR